MREAVYLSAITCGENRSTGNDKLWIFFLLRKEMADLSIVYLELFCTVVL